MTDTPPKPKHRGWRWLLVGAVCFAATMLVLRDRPSLDPRLVGRWQTATLPTPWPHVHTFEIRADGVIVEDDGLGLGSKTEGVWTLKDDTIVLQSNPGLHAFRRFQQGLQQRLWQWWSSGPPQRPPDAFRIVKLSGDALELEYIGVCRSPPPVYTLTRLPE